MNPKRRKRLYMIIIMITGVMITVSLALYALNNNINLYYTPSQITQEVLQQHRNMRIGGMVEKGSFHRIKNTLQVDFVVTDFTKQLAIQYNGILPALFREGQGIVAEGSFNESGVFVAKQILAKHDEKYMPPGIPQKVKK